MASEVTRRTFVGALGTALAAGVTGHADGGEPAPASPSKAVRLEAGKNTHENVVFACSGGFSNVALITHLASLEAVKELGIDKVVIGCLAGLPNGNVPLVAVLAKASRRVVTVDGCPNQCARKIVEAAGLKTSRNIVLSRDANVEKHTFHADVGGNAKAVMEYIRGEDVKRAKKLIVDAINEA